MITLLAVLSVVLLVMFLSFPRAALREDESFTHPTKLPSSALPLDRKDFRAALRPDVKKVFSKSGIKPNVWYEVTGNVYGDETAFHVQMGADAYGRALTPDEGFGVAAWVYEFFGGGDPTQFGVHRVKLGKWEKRDIVFMCFEQCVFDDSCPVGSVPIFPTQPDKQPNPAVAAKVAALAINLELFKYKRDLQRPKWTLRRHHQPRPRPRWWRGCIDCWRARSRRAGTRGC